MRLAQSTCNLAPHVGDYGLETNRRVFFSSLCGELGMPTYGSSGYDWESAMDIWFDSIASGTLGSLHCFEGDQNSEKPTATHISKFNAINRTVLLALRMHQLDGKRTPNQ
jgi:hypothetical protein